MRSGMTGTCISDRWPPPSLESGLHCAKVSGTTRRLSRRTIASAIGSWRCWTATSAALHEAAMRLYGVAAHPARTNEILVDSGVEDHHGLRTGWLAERVARRLGLDTATVQSVAEAASFHDIGKRFVDEA